MKITKMIKEITILLVVMTAIFSLISTCLSQYVKYPAKVTINEARTSHSHSYKLKVEGKCKTWNLKLDPMENIWSDVAQVVSITKDENGTAVFERKNIPKNLRAYHDVHSGSILSVRSNEITGILDSHTSIICEDEEHFIVELEKKTKRKIDDILIPDEIPSKDFVVRFDEDENNDTNITVASRMSGARNAEVIYTPEIVAIVDSELSNIMRTDFKVYDYLNLFWNEIKLQYQYINNPKIHVKLVGCLIIRDPEDEPFITNNLDENNRISLHAVINDLIKYVYSKNYLIPPHDIVYLHTNKLSSDSEGMAAIEGVCSIDTTRNVSWSVGVGLDRNAVFAGTLTAAHELGHLLGAYHDDKSKNLCDSLDGYLMGYPHGTRNSYYFSNCSLQSITTNLAKSSASCLQTQFKETTPPGVFNCSILPGYIISMGDQCRYISGDSTADVDLTTTPEDKLCYNLQCITKQGVWNSQVRAAERSLCPSGKRCSFGACV